MSIRKWPVGTAGVLALIGAAAGAQKPPAVRQIGRLERVSSDSLASVASAVSMPGSRVLVNDIVARRVVLFDSTLAHATVVADTTSGTSNRYGSRAGNLIRFRADSALFIEPSSLSMFIIGPTGTIGRIMAVPHADDVQGLLVGPYGLPGVDARGRLVYYSDRDQPADADMRGLGEALSKDALARLNRSVDSAFIVRTDLATRVLDTAASIRIPKIKKTTTLDARGMLAAIVTFHDPLPLIDGWAVMPDGAIGIVRGRDYHMDWVDADGHASSGPTIPFDWQRLSDDRKAALIDSTAKRWQAQFDRIMGNTGGGGGSGGTSSGRGGSGSGAPGRGGPSSALAPLLAGRQAISELPDYVPAFTWVPGGYSVRADADGNLWVRTTAVIDGRPVYDIVNRRGDLVDRVQLPTFRTIAGFGPGVIYMAVKDATGAVHLERARVK
jgi:hypothetical protein